MTRARDSLKHVLFRVVLQEAFTISVHFNLRFHQTVLRLGKLGADQRCTSDAAMFGHQSLIESARVLRNNLHSGARILIENIAGNWL